MVALAESHGLSALPVNIWAPTHDGTPTPKRTQGRTILPWALAWASTLSKSDQL